MIRITFLLESMTLILGLPWCVSWALMWAGCQEYEPTARERAMYEALQIRINEKMQCADSAASATEQEPIPQI